LKALVIIATESPSHGTQSELRAYLVAGGGTHVLNQPNCMHQENDCSNSDVRTM
jgi:hypothetical protein